MCQAMEEWKEELLTAQREHAIKSVMQTLSLTIDQAMDALQIPEDERAIYKSITECPKRS